MSRAEAEYRDAHEDCARSIAEAWALWTGMEVHPMYVLDALYTDWAGPSSPSPPVEGRRVRRPVRRYSPEVESLDGDLSGSLGSDTSGEGPLGINTPSSTHSYAPSDDDDDDDDDDEDEGRSDASEDALMLIWRALPTRMWYRQLSDRWAPDCPDGSCARPSRVDKAQLLARALPYSML